MAAIKPIEGRSVHQIQSGQVIVDLCSVVKELLENSLDAGASSVEVRFKSNGLDRIEVQDNGIGIAPEDFDSIALKHHTSKLSNYADLDSLQTFGFRGEALSSLCAVSRFYIVTARASDGPKGTRLDFETSGRLKSKSFVASQKGTTAVVEDIFRTLPVRRRELEKNIKREYGKVLGLLHAYACISTDIKFSVSHQPVKGKKVPVFATQSNSTTRENIANVYGAKTLSALVPLDLSLEMQLSSGPAQSTKIWSTQDDATSRQVRIEGYISRPVVGEGRQAPDRQMFFVNSRPCALPQVAKAINEVYRSYNVTQSPFIFANLKMDTNSYDVNVSPDKRTILLHDQSLLLEEMKNGLLHLFDTHDQSVPQALSNRKLPAFRQLTVKATKSLVDTKQDSTDVLDLARPPSPTEADDDPSSSPPASGAPASIIRKFADRHTVKQQVPNACQKSSTIPQNGGSSPEDDELQQFRQGSTTETLAPQSVPTLVAASAFVTAKAVHEAIPKPVQDFNDRVGGLPPAAARRSPSSPCDPDSEIEQRTITSISELPSKVLPSVIETAFDRIRPQRASSRVATVSSGGETMITTIGTPEAKRRRIHTPRYNLHDNKAQMSSPLFRRSIRAFTAPHAQTDQSEEEVEAEAETVQQEGDPEQVEAYTIISSSTGQTTENSTIFDVEDEPSDRDVDHDLFVKSDDTPDDEYMDDNEKKVREEARIAKMIKRAEETAVRPTSDNIKRATSALKGRIRKDSSFQWECFADTSLEQIQAGAQRLQNLLQQSIRRRASIAARDEEEISVSDEERLSLTVSKPDFARMRIVGQFNLGFILTVRPGPSRSGDGCTETRPAGDELFIIDQHASDEKYNFERLQGETIVQNQRLVHPKLLDLTAVEEEIILNHPSALVKNGFLIDTDESGNSPVGQRCRLTSLPMSKEVVFDVRDLEELVVLLSEQAGSEIPRPSKVRRMFAMRACRSSIMVGKTLTIRQMEKVVRHMGEIDKPWNCPHGRPTMRHLFGLEDWAGWTEGDGLVGMGEDTSDEGPWAGFVTTGRANGMLPSKEDNIPLTSTAVS